MSPSYSVATESAPVWKNMRFFKYWEINDADTFYVFKSSFDRSAHVLQEEMEK
jgi:hypothetical protein